MPDPGSGPKEGRRGQPRPPGTTARAVLAGTEVRGRVRRPGRVTPARALLAGTGAAVRVGPHGHVPPGQPPGASAGTRPVDRVTAGRPPGQPRPRPQHPAQLRGPARPAPPGGVGQMAQGRGRAAIPVAGTGLPGTSAGRRAEPATPAPAPAVPGKVAPMGGSPAADVPVPRRPAPPIAPSAATVRPLGAIVALAGSPHPELRVAAREHGRGRRVSTAQLAQGETGRRAHPEMIGAPDRHPERGQEPHVAGRRPGAIAALVPSSRSPVGIGAASPAGALGSFGSRRTVRPPRRGGLPSLELGTNHARLPILESRPSLKTSGFSTTTASMRTVKKTRPGRRREPRRAGGFRTGTRSPARFSRS